MEIHIPVAEYETNHATLLKSNMVRNPIIPICFLNSQTSEKGVTGRSAEIDITTQFNSLSFDMPEFAIVLFQTDRSNNQLKDSSLFDHCKLGIYSSETAEMKLFLTKLEALILLMINI